MNDTNSNGYGTDDAYGSSGYNSPGYQSSGYEAPGYQSPGYVNGTGYDGSTGANGYRQDGYTPPDTWVSGYQENVHDRANLLDTPYLYSLVGSFLTKSEIFFNVQECWWEGIRGELVGEVWGRFNRS